MGVPRARVEEAAGWWGYRASLINAGGFVGGVRTLVNHTAFFGGSLSLEPVLVRCPHLTPTHR